MLKSSTQNEASTLPYSIAEWTQRLTIAFAEHRNDPENPHVRAKCLVFAGILSHYAADLHMPLHTSIHWDGRDDAGAMSSSGVYYYHLKTAEGEASRKMVMVK